ncbi:MAG: zinc-dependent alcohol dehydrogenase family protein [Bacteroidota bacterium]|jgi:propanol-preferring alcohol dehydrogenase|nr:MAG: alcohol dehydrogenase [Bacteroidota bacterium]
MKAYLLTSTMPLTEQSEPLQFSDVPTPEPGHDELLIKVSCCGVCHTELDEIEGRTPPPAMPVIPGHQVVGVVEHAPSGRFKPGDRVGVAWIFSACGQCEYCLRGNENLCPQFLATGRDRHGGYAEYMVVPERYAYPIPDLFKDEEAAPLLCAGAIGYRSLMLTGIRDGQRLGLTGFGASGHLVLKMSKFLFPTTPIYVFARNENERSFARSIGASWAGNTTDTPPEPLHAIIDTTPAWTPVVAALSHLQPGGRLVINAIRKESGDKPALQEMDYPSHIWMEKEIKSVANITRKDVEEFLMLAARAGIKPDHEVYDFRDANRALLDLKFRPAKGARVLLVGNGQ